MRGRTRIKITKTRKTYRHASPHRIRQLNPHASDYFEFSYFSVTIIDHAKSWPAKSLPRRARC